MKIYEIQGLSNLLNGLKPSALSTSSMRSLVKLNKDLAAKSEEHSELQKQLMESYEVEVVDDRYSWTGHEKADEITEKFNDLFQHEYEVGPLNFIEENEFYASCGPDAKLNEITFLGDLLILEEKKTSSNTEPVEELGPQPEA